jgi:hypothetical protein
MFKQVLEIRHAFNFRADSTGQPMLEFEPPWPTGTLFEITNYGPEIIQVEDGAHKRRVDPGASMILIREKDKKLQIYAAAGSHSSGIVVIKPAGVV